MKIEKNFKLRSYRYETDYIYENINRDQKCTLEMISDCGEELTISTYNLFDKKTLSLLMNDSLRFKNDSNVCITFEVKEEKLI